MQLAITPNEREVYQILLRDIRQEAGLLQQQVADALRVPQSFVSKYESGTRRLDVLEFRCVCTVLGVTPEEVMRRLEERLSVRT